MSDQHFRAVLRGRSVLAILLLCSVPCLGHQTAERPPQEVDEGPPRDSVTDQPDQPELDESAQNVAEDDVASESSTEGKVGWLQLVLLALGSGVTVKGLDIVYSEFTRRRQVSVTAAKTVATHLDPILKSADELVGKLRSLAEEDFAEFRDLSSDSKRIDTTIVMGNSLYLFAHFWARLEILRKESISVHISADPKGKLLWSFLRCIESRRVRLLDRARTRAIGELLFKTVDGRNVCLNFREFLEQYMAQDRLREWFGPLEKLLCHTGHTRERQRVLQYGTVLHAMIDTLDAKHEVTRDRPAFPNKLTRKTRDGLVYRVFGRYLPEVKDSAKFTRGS